MSSNKLALVPSSQSTALEIQQIKSMSLEAIESLAKHFAKSNLYGMGDAAISQSVVKILAGKEMGIPPFMSMKEIYLIPSKTGTKIQYSGKLLGRLVAQSEIYDYKIVKIEKDICSIDFYEKDKKTGEFELKGNSTFTMQDAIDAKLVDNDTYKKFPRNMLKNRALSNGVDWFCPLLGVGTPDLITEENPNQTNQQSFIDIQIEQSESFQDNQKAIQALEAMHQMALELDFETPTDGIFDSYSSKELSNLLLTYSISLKTLLLDRIKSLDPNLDKSTYSKIELTELYSLYNQLLATTV